MGRRKAAQNCAILPWLSGKADGREGRFLQIGNSLLLDKRFHALSSGARYLYLCLSMESGGKKLVQFSRGTTAKKYGIPKNSFTRQIDELVEHGFVRRVEAEDYLQFAPAIYELSVSWKSEPAPQNGAR